MLNRIKLALVALVVLIGGAVPTAAIAATDYQSCLQERCFGKFVNDPAGYDLCRQECAAEFPPNFAPASFGRLVAKLN